MKCPICGDDFETAHGHPQRRLALICLQCDLAAWELEDEEWRRAHLAETERAELEEHPKP